MKAIIREKGVNAFLIRLWLKENYGESGLANMIARLSQDSKEMLIAPVSSEWYPVVLLKETYSAMSDAYGTSKLTEYGRFAAEHSLKGFLRYLTRFLSMQQLIKRMGAFWKQYHKGGGISAGEVYLNGDRKEVTVTVRARELGKAGCDVIQGYLEGLIPLTKVTDPRIQKQTCIHKGDEVCTWLVSWTP